MFIFKDASKCIGRIEQQITISSTSNKNNKRRNIKRNEPFKHFSLKKKKM